MRSLQTLYLKELRSLLPFLLLVLVFIAITFLDVGLTEFPDQQTLAVMLNHDSESNNGLIVLFFLTFALSQGLLMRERSESTIEFLDSLPTNRSRVFACKCAAGLTVLLLFPLSMEALFFFLHAISRHSSAPDLQLAFFAKGLFIEVWMLLVFFGIGLAFSFLGRFALLALVFAGLWYGTLKEMQLPWVELFDPFSIGSTDDSIVGDSLIIPWKPLFAQMGTSSLLLLLSWLGFTKLGTSQNKRAPWKKRLTLSLLFVGISIAGISWYVVTRRSNADASPAIAVDPTTPNFPSWKTSQAKTDSFTFIYPSNQTDRAEKLITAAESVHLKITSFLHAEPSRKLVVDLTSRSPRHAGTAYWKRVRMNLGSGSSNHDREAVLGHELTHVYISQLSDNKVNDRFNSTRFFHEGLASYLEYRLFRKPGKLPNIRKLAAVARDRDHIRFEQLVDSDKLSRTHAFELVYPLGEIFIAAVVKSYGDSAPEKLIRAFAREDAPAQLDAMTLWEDTFQSCGYNLEQAIATFYELLEQEIKQHRQFLDELPVIRTESSRIGDWIVLKFTSASESTGTELRPGQVFCRFRVSADTPESQYWPRFADDENTIRVPIAYFPGKTFWYQTGLRSPGLSAPVMSPWKRSPVPERRSGN